MPKYRPVYIRIWKDRDFLKASKDAKLLFLYFITNESRNNSGIYEIPIDTISRENSIRSQTVRELLVNGSIKNIEYDMENEIVFVVNAHQYSSGGNPEKVAKGIISEFEQSSKSFLWNSFLDRYPAFRDILPTVPQPFPNGSLPLPLPIKDLTNNNPLKMEDETSWKIQKQEAFEKAWTDYPGTPDNKKQSNGHWNASIKTPADIVAYELALEGYLRMIQTCGYDRSFKGAKTWFNNWQDYIRVEETAALTEPDNPAPLPVERVRGEPELEKLWDNTLEKIKAHILPEAHEAWFEVVYPCRMEEGILMIACPNQFIRKGMIENYRDLIEITTKEFHGSPVLVDFCVVGGVAS